MAHGTGKSLSEALIFTTNNPQYDDRLFIKLQVQKLFLAFRTILVTKYQNSDKSETLLSLH